ncbi:MAG TPA: aspartate/glutamate racemase family protein [Candidatus Aquilonibacter sp.]
MKKIGMVGGTAWVSTVEYYSAICALGADSDMQPEFSIESIDNARAQSYIGVHGDEASWERFDAYHRDALLRVERSGAEVAFLAANTPHHRFEAITAGVDIPVVNIVDAVARVCHDDGIDRLLLLGTALTMSSATIRHRFAARGIEAIAPPERERSAIVERIERLQRGDDEGAIVHITRLANGHRAVALACTELPLAFPDERRSASFEREGVRYLNTLAIHAQAVFDYAR